jgi:7,8-dihydropterin-6-yl-methyl-4-(beta-D-ribofuranosyl)aminobenzene 5'-phosphate synthase
MAATLRRRSRRCRLRSGRFTGERIPLQPVERVHVTTLVDNVLDVLAADVGLAKRHPLGAWPRLPVAGDQRQAVVDKVVDGPVGEHGFSALVDVKLAGGDWHRVFFDAGISPDGMVSNMGRLAPDSIEVVVCSRALRPHHVA